MTEPLAQPAQTKRYRLCGPDGTLYESETRGTVCGNRNSRIYGRLNCPTAIRNLPLGYARFRVFFADEAAAIAAGFRPCGTCLKPRHRKWKRGGILGSAEYPWLIAPEPSEKADA